MQNLNKEYIETLAEKKLRGTITAEEQHRLSTWLEQKLSDVDEMDMTEVEYEALRTKILDKIKEDAGIAHGATSRKRKGVHYRWVAAAAVFIVIGTLSYTLLFKKNTEPAVAVRNTTAIHHIAPGHSGAILTLANGKQVILDSLRNGKITLQGGNALTKKNGQVIYGKRSTTAGSQAHEVAYNTLSTPRGREFQIVLPDGSKVWLNASSSITYPVTFTGKERNVKITGEVYFEIAQNSERPFIVATRDARIKVLGTHFDVSAYDSEKQIKTTLLEGAVSVQSALKRVILQPGQQAVIDSKLDHIQVETVNADNVIAWTKGKLSLDNLDLETIMKRISRWYDVDVEFEGAIPKGHYWGVINRDVKLSEMLRVLQANGIHAEQNNGKIIVKGEKRIVNK